jgi:hypothetical protein
MDLLLTDDDMFLENGELQFTTGAPAIGQHIKMRLRTWLGESGAVYDTAAGVPFLQVIFRGKNPNLDAVNFILTQIMLGTPGVISGELTPVLDTVTRELTVSGTANTIDGEVDFSLIIKAEE